MRCRAGPRSMWPTVRREHLMRLRAAVPLLPLLVAATVLAAAPPASATVQPHVLAATGDSITRAFDVDGSHFLKDAPAESWATGTDTRVASVATRLAARGTLTAFNDAKTGAKMSALDSQLVTAASQGADAVTVEMGANDVCTSSVSTMTPTATFSAQFDTALQHFLAVRTGATVAVSSIPNIYQLWSVLHTSSSARFTWSLLGECKSMLASSATETQRQAVLTQEKADNAALATVCARYTGCQWDGGAVFGTTFTAAQVSTVDYFHPNVSGQAVLASTAWSSGPWQ
jgi:lysophospholipase L1-like esterase